MIIEPEMVLKRPSALADSGLTDHGIWPGKGRKKKNSFGGIFWNQTRKVRGSSIDRHSRRLRLLGENRYPVQPVIGGGDTDHFDQV